MLKRTDQKPIKPQNDQVNKTNILKLLELFSSYNFNVIVRVTAGWLNIRIKSERKRKTDFRQTFRRPRLWPVFILEGLRRERGTAEQTQVTGFGQKAIIRYFI